MYSCFQREVCTGCGEGKCCYLVYSVLLFINGGSLFNLRLEHAMTSTAGSKKT